MRALCGNAARQLCGNAARQLCGIAARELHEKYAAMPHYNDATTTCARRANYGFADKDDALQYVLI
jgi:hypothetical protein